MKVLMSLVIFEVQMVYTKAGNMLEKARSTYAQLEYPITNLALIGKNPSLNYFC